MRGEGEPTALRGDARWRTITLVAMALLGIAVFVALVLTLVSANAQRDRALAQQRHSYDVMILARSLSGTIARSEASLGRYVLSGDRDLGQLYFDQWRLAASQLNRLDQLVNDNDEQQRRIDRLRADFDTRGQELAITALSTNYGKNSQALSRFYKARQSPALAAIDSALESITNEELDLLDKRTLVARHTVERGNQVAGVLAMFGLLIVVGASVLGWFTVQTLGDRAAAKAEAEAEHQRADELESAVAAATDELRVQEAKLRQAQKMDAVGQLTGGIAHDFNNMLAVVLGGLELARRNVDSPAAATRHIESATDGANRAAALTRRLLAFSREELLKPEPIAAASLVEGMSELLDRTLGDGIQVTVVDRSAGWSVLADRVQLENAVLNLAVNARDAMNGRGKLTITTARKVLRAGEVGTTAAGEHVTIAVADNGAGMTPEVLERAYEPFFTTKEAGKGTGLGLSQIFALVRQLGGEIAIDTAVGRGTTVTLYLPRAQPAATPGEVVEMPPAAPQPPGPLQVLVVEDDPRVLAATIGALDEIGHHPIACNSPLAAADLLAEHPGVQLIISDVLMPGQTGPEMIARLGPLYPHVAVLFVTGYAGEANAAEFGDHQVLRKPFTLVGLERCIAAVMDRNRPAPPEQIAAE